VAKVTEAEVSASQSAHDRRLEDAQSLTMQATHTRVVVQHELEEESSSRLTLIRAVLLLAALASVGFVGWKWRQRWLDRSGGPPVQVVLVPMEGTTGDLLLDKSLTQAMRMDLAQSSWVTVVSTSNVKDSPLETVAALQCFQGYDPAEGVTEHEDGFRKLCSDLSDIVGFTLDRVDCGVRAVSEPPSVHGVGMELRLEQRRDARPRFVKTPRPIDEKQAWAASPSSTAIDVPSDTFSRSDPVEALLTGSATARSPARN